MTPRTDIEDMTDAQDAAGQCATEGCTRAGVIYFERGGIGSHYCSFCHAGLRPDAPKKVWAWENAGWSVAGASTLNSANDGESVLYVRADLARPSQAGDERVATATKALKRIEELSRLVAHDLQGRVEGGKVAGVLQCADVACAALAAMKDRG